MGLLKRFLARHGKDERDFLSGWRDDPDARRRFRERNRLPFFRQHASAVKGAGKGQQVMLWKHYEQVTGRKFVARDQDITDCVGFASALGVDVLTAVQIVLHGRKEQWKGDCSPELIYGGSRVEIAGGFRGGGSTGAWATQFMRGYGTLLRGKYGEIDITEYRPDLAKLWGRVGVPDELEPVAKQHPVKTATLVEGWDEVCDSVASGYPILLCSSPGYSLHADADGFCNMIRRKMRHAWCILGIDSKSKREGAAVFTSWGDCVRGPQHALGSPEGCLWIDAKNIDRMVSQGDSYALSNFDGYPSQDVVRYQLW